MESVSARVTRCPSCMVLRGHLSLSGAAVGSGGHFHALLTGGGHWDKRDSFLSAGDSEYPILWQIGRQCALVRPGSLSQTHPLATFSETGKFSPAKGLAQIQTQFSSVVQSSPTLCDPMDCSTPGLPVHHQLRSSLKLMSIQLVMPSNHLILCRPLLLLLSISPSIRVFSNESTLRIRCPKYWNFSFNISPSNEHAGLISFRMNWLDLLAVQGTLRSLLQHHSSKASILLRSAFFTVQLSHPYMTTGKTIALTRWTLVGKLMSLLLNMLSRLVITFLPRNKRLLISWLQSPSAVILEPQKIKSDTVSTVSPSISHEVIGLDAMILVF
ncbi:uncharacterized protein LOC132659361 [Ovis aries]|uniref:uncharacterized protein LOC132659361 n=1 Tax=Ovis aries TaxID=9940 RepID=UPI0029526DAF|nr:uncharacterized protein LOC132659361 [Ovis aries]